MAVTLTQLTAFLAVVRRGSVTAAAAAIYGVALAADASQLAGAPNGPFGLLSTATSLVVQLVVMGAAGGLAVTSTMRGRQGLH